ncbi:MAG: hypothetical protein ACLPLR_18740 [Terriglobales bacterium]
MDLLAFAGKVQFQDKAAVGEDGFARLMTFAEPDPSPAMTPAPKFPAVTLVTGGDYFAVDFVVVETLESSAGGSMKDIHEVLRRKQAQYTQLGKQIEMLQQAAEKLREVAPLLAETELEDDSAVLTEVDDEGSNAMAAKASAQSSPAASKPGRSATPRWP